MKFLHHSEFSSLSEFERIVVVGPQRSGTKIAANMICCEIGYSLVMHHYMPPNENGLNKFRAESSIVLHSPGFFKFRKDIQDTDAMIFVWRELDDIRKSEERFNMPVKIKHYDTIYNISLASDAKSKQDMWSDEHKDLKNAFNIRYEDLKDHELWANKDERSKFNGVNQVDKDGTKYACAGVRLFEFNTTLKED